jgi:DNA-binding helix-hairpin-helix protein with protein kinase domain
MSAVEVMLAATPRRRLELSPRPIGEGGQAAVFGVDADPGLVVKLYHAPTPEIERRLESMLLLARPDDFLSDDGTGHPALTWPSAMVQDVASGEVIGYAMRRVDTPEFLPLGTLFNPAQRRAYFPDISWRFLLGLGRNLAGLVTALHDRGLVLGDISHANLVVSRRGYLSFLDCDSMQFTDPRSGEHFPCAYLTAEYAAPELQARSGVDRTAATDTFSLAVLACRLLLVGDHPFMGIRLGGRDDDADAARNIVDGYCHLVRPEEMGLPPGTIDPGVLPPPVLALARRTFGPGHGDADARPTAEEWFTALDEALERTATCGASSRHVHGAHLPQCPWCARSRAGASDPFASSDPRSGAPTPGPARSAGVADRWRGWAIALVVLVVLVLLILLG